MACKRSANTNMTLQQSRLTAIPRYGNLQSLFPVTAVDSQTVTHTLLAPAVTFASCPSSCIPLPFYHPRAAHTNERSSFAGKLHTSRHTLTFKGSFQ
mgnify:CR=1 FL=1